MIKMLTWLFGIFLLAIGLLGFINNPVFGLFEVDTMQNIFHILSGIIAIVAVIGGESYARLYLIIIGIIYALVAILGFAMNGDILGFFATNRAGDYLHTAIALASLAVGFGKKK